MKIKHVNSDANDKETVCQRFLMNVYYFFELYRYIFIALLAVVLIAFVSILAVELLKPSLLKDIDSGTTVKLFDQLQAENRHQDAITLMEYKGAVLEDRNYEQEYKLKLSESYIQTGDYSKAEKVLLDVWDDLQEEIGSLDMDILEKHPGADKLIQFSTARIIYQMYEKMGDHRNQKKFYELYRSFYDEISFRVDDLLGDFQKIGDRTQTSSMPIEFLVRYDSIVVASLDDLSDAIVKMTFLLEDLVPNPDYPAGFKVRCLNKLISWELQTDHLLDAYANISRAVSLIPLMTNTGEYRYLGELSDLCYMIHDVRLSRDIFQKYKKFLKEYDEDDEDYIKNRMREFRYLEEDGEWDELTESLVAYCEGMRKQISINMPSMSGEQREFLAKRFEKGYDYAVSVLKEHPSQELANLCFDNMTFKNGLLLRSNITIRHNIENLDDPEAIAKYDELCSYRRELVYHSVDGNRIIRREDRLEQRIEELEKELAMTGVEYKTKNDLEEYGYAKIQRFLKKGESVVEFIQHGNDLLAFVLNKTGQVSYVPICSMDDLEYSLQRPIGEVYHDPDLTSLLMSDVIDNVGDCRCIYYVPSGIFNQIAMGTLYVGRDAEGKDRYIADNMDMTLLSNPSDLMREEDFHITDSDCCVSLWGGIDYGGSNDSCKDRGLTRKPITRGQELHNLRYAYEEVSAISGMLSDFGVKNRIYTRMDATEESFKARSGKHDEVLHVSTHGFFNQQQDGYLSMLESGLFFAGANRYWKEGIRKEAGEEDGLLRGAEISTIDLSGCELMILSACETGLGFSSTSEGVYGLQRAFKLAGVNQILMSLWEVDDRATNILMKNFYQNLLQGNSTEEALKQSKLAVRKEYRSPEYWGAFVLLH